MSAFLVVAFAERWNCRPLSWCPVAAFLPTNLCSELFTKRSFLKDLSLPRSALLKWKTTPNPSKDRTLVGLQLVKEPHSTTRVSILGLPPAPGLGLQRLCFPRKVVVVQPSTAFVTCVATFTDATCTEICLVQEHCNERRKKNSNMFQRGAYKYLLYLKCSLSKPRTLGLLTEGAWWTMADRKSSTRLPCSFSNEGRVHGPVPVATGLICRKRTYLGDWLWKRKLQ